MGRCLRGLASTEARLLAVYHPEVEVSLAHMLGFEGRPTKSQIRAAEENPSFARNADLVRTLNDVNNQLSQTYQIYHLERVDQQVKSEVTEADMLTLIGGIDAVCEIIAGTIRSTWSLRDLT